MRTDDDATTTATADPPAGPAAAPASDTLLPGVTPGWQDDARPAAGLGGIPGPGGVVGVADAVAADTEASVAHSNADTGAAGYDDEAGGPGWSVHTHPHALAGRRRPWQDGEPSVGPQSYPTVPADDPAAIDARADAADAADDALARGAVRPASARRLVADLIEAARDAEALADMLEARDLTAPEAAAVLEAECPGLPFRLIETATESRGFDAVASPSLRTCSAVAHWRPGGMRTFHGTAWRPVVADLLAAYRGSAADPQNGGGR